MSNWLEHWYKQGHLSVCETWYRIPSPLTTSHTGLPPRPSFDQSCFSCPAPETVLAQFAHLQHSNRWQLITWVTTWGSKACWEHSQQALFHLVWVCWPNGSRISVELVFKDTMRLIYEGSSWMLLITFSVSSVTSVTALNQRSPVGAANALISQALLSTNRVQCAGLFLQNWNENWVKPRGVCRLKTSSILQSNLCI